MSRVKLKSDARFETVLTTDILPYETTLPYSNDGYFRYQVGKSKSKPTLIEVLFSDKSVKIPFLYEYSRDNFKNRKVGIIHPLEQLKFIEFYSLYESELIYYCKKSKFSLRHIVSKVKSLNIKNEKLGLLHPNKYYKYGPYNYLHQFYSSFEYVRLEKTFKFQLKADISKCFNSIYTHSISWAVTGKSHAKQNLNASSFDHKFDALMQNANYKETNGIIIGPEVSRIFAEIILQSIDVAIEIKLKHLGYEYGNNYKIRRYVDDYMIFANSQKEVDQIYEIIEDELSLFKLSLNESKKSYSKSPFISPISSAKIEISNIANQFYNQFLQVNILETPGNINRLSAGLIKRIKFPYDISMRFINQLKGLIEDKDIKISDVSRFAVSIIRYRIFELLKLDKDFSTLDSKKSENLTRFISINVDVLLYLISMDTVVTNLTKMTAIIDRINDFYNKNSLPGLDLIRARAANELKFTIRRHDHKDKSNSIEFIQMLICLKTLGSENRLNGKEIGKLVNINSLTYWGITGLLYYFGHNKEFDFLKSYIHTRVVNILKNSGSLSASENFCLFFDYVKSPFVSNTAKEEVIVLTGRNNDLTLSNQNVNQVKNYIMKNNWFFNWNTSVKKLLASQQNFETY